MRAQIAGHRGEIGEHCVPHRLRQGRASLLLTDLLEGYTFPLVCDVSMLGPLYSYLDTIDLPPARVCYCCASSNRVIRRCQTIRARSRSLCGAGTS